MGRTGDKFLNPLKESLRDTYASVMVRYTVEDLVVQRLNKFKEAKA